MVIGTGVHGILRSFKLKNLYPTLRVEKILCIFPQQNAMGHKAPVVGNVV